MIGSNFEGFMPCDSCLREGWRIRMPCMIGAVILPLGKKIAKGDV